MKRVYPQKIDSSIIGLRVTTPNDDNFRGLVVGLDDEPDMYVILWTREDDNSGYSYDGYTIRDLTEDHFHYFL